MSSDTGRKSSDAAGQTGLILRRLKGADLFMPHGGGPALEVDRELPRAPHGAEVRLSRIDPDSGRVVGYQQTGDGSGSARVVGRVEKRTARVELRLESAVREGSYPLEGAEDLAHGQFVAARLASGKAIVEEVLGEAPTAGLRIAAVIDEFQLSTQFSEEVLAAAEAIQGPRDWLPREDLRRKPFVTIDGVDAKDFDDAVLAEKRGGGFKLYVAIADVSAHVSAGDALDRSARERGTSVYFPGRVLPMLPHRLADDLCSLRPHVDRAVLVCEMDLRPDGSFKSVRFYPALICSQARLIYEDVSQALSSGDFSEDWNRDVRRNLRNLAQLHKALDASRALRGALDFDSRELQVQLDEEGQVVGMRVPERTLAHRLIEECMILANVAAAKALRKAKQPFLARIHEAPDQRKLEALREYLGGLGLSLGGGESPDPGDYAKLLLSTRQHAQADSIQLAVLQSLQQAVYAPSDAGHFGLALEDYAHFTSPIRRYPDLLVHRALYSMLGAPIQANEDWDSLGGQCSALERRADKAGWAVIEALKCDFLRDKVGSVMGGVITGVTEFGLFIELREVGVSGLAHISQLGNDYFVLESQNRRLRGQRTGQMFKLGQSIDVRIAAVDAAARKLDLIPVAAEPSPETAPRSRRR